MKGLVHCSPLASGEGVYKVASWYNFSIVICELLPRACRIFSIYLRAILVRQDCVVLVLIK